MKDERQDPGSSGTVERKQETPPTGKKQNSVVGDRRQTA